MRSTTPWLGSPRLSDGTPPRRGGSEELPLARIQFAGALTSLVDAGRVKADTLGRAAALLIVHQRDDGSWRLSESQIVGGATFYGTTLATAMARRSLARARTDAVQRPLAMASAWLRTIDTAAVLDASAVLLGLERDADATATAQRRRSLEVVKRGQGADGGWGPYVTSQPEPFDTALAVLALAGVRNVDALVASPYSRRDLEEAIRQGRSPSWPLRILMEARRKRQGRRTEKATRSAFRRPPGRCWRSSNQTELG